MPEVPARGGGVMRYDPSKTGRARARLAQAQGIVEIERRARARQLPPVEKELEFARLREQLDVRAADRDEPHDRVRLARQDGTL